MSDEIKNEHWGLVHENEQYWIQHADIAEGPREEFVRVGLSYPICAEQARRLTLLLNAVAPDGVIETTLLPNDELRFAALMAYGALQMAEHNFPGARFVRDTLGAALGIQSSGDAGASERVV